MQSWETQRSRCLGRWTHISWPYLFISSTAWPFPRDLITYSLVYCGQGHSKNHHPQAIKISGSDLSDSELETEERKTALSPPPLILGKLGEESMCTNRKQGVGTGKEVTGAISHREVQPKIQSSSHG